MKRYFTGLAFVGSILLTSSCSTGDNGLNAVDQLDEAEVKLETALEWMNDTTRNPRTIEDGEVKFVRSRDWTSGFFPGMLWLMVDYTGEPAWVEAADHYSMNIEQEKFNGGTHDMGFKMYCSFGNGYRLTNNPKYKDILIQSAATLATRYNPTVGCIRSWDHNTDKWDFPVIIDNMMNLELLFWAARETRDLSYYDIAVKHAETTLKNHFREDNSSFHVIAYDTLTGEVVKRNTHQGYAHESAWARGQAWGLYGFTMCYRETGIPQFLTKAMQIADFILQHPNLPEDKVPYWDFDVPVKEDTPRDVSAAAIIASALYELALYAEEESDSYLEVAEKILVSLSSAYEFEGTEPYPFLLDHSTGNFNKDSEVDVPIIYADYYYLEALLRSIKLAGSKHRAL